MREHQNIGREAAKEPGKRPNAIHGLCQRPRAETLHIRTISIYRPHSLRHSLVASNSHHRHIATQFSVFPDRDTPAYQEERLSVGTWKTTAGAMPSASPPSRTPVASSADSRGLGKHRIRTEPTARLISIATSPWTLLQVRSVEAHPVPLRHRPSARIEMKGEEVTMLRSNLYGAHPQGGTSETLERTLFSCSMNRRVLRTDHDDGINVSARSKSLSPVYRHALPVMQIGIRCKTVSPIYYLLSSGNPHFLREYRDPYRLLRTSLHHAAHIILYAVCNSAI
jgi:hypothetical protein